MSNYSLALFAILTVTVISLWLPKLYLFTSLLSVIAVGLSYGVMDGWAVLWLGLLAISCGLHVNANGGKRTVFLGIAVALAFALGLHLLPGFRSVELVGPTVLSPGAVPFSLQLSMDKVMAGILLAAIVWKRYITTREEFAIAWKASWSIIAINIVVLVALSVAIGYLNFAPKFTALFWIWAAHNLLFTCLGEEIFFRGLLQTELTRRLYRVENGIWIALGISSLLFGAVHFAGGWQYVLLATVAGVGYGYVFIRTGRIEMAMLAHFAMNAVHFLLFAYPRLA